MTDYPTRGQQAPDYWDLQLKAWIEEQVAAASGGSGARGDFYPETYDAVGDGVADDTAAIQAAIDAAEAAGGGVVVLSKTYGFTGDLLQKNGVSVRGVSIAGPAAPDAKLVALDATARYRWGKLDGPGAHPYPGTLGNLTIDGAGVAGAGTSEVLRVEAVETSAYDLHVLNGVACLVDLASSQNLNFFNPNFGSCTEGTALRIRGKAAGSQPPGHCVFYGGHLGDAKRTILVTSHDSSFFVGPHDNYFIGTIIETGRGAYDIDDIISAEDGDTHFMNCVFTIGAQVTAINSDCSIKVSNPIRSAATTVVLDDCSIGGGAGAVKATYGVRVIGSGGVNNIVNYSTRTSFANVTYGHAHDGADGSVTMDGPHLFVTAVTDLFTSIAGGALAGVLNLTKVPRRWVMGSGTGNPIQVRRDTDTVSNKLQITRDGAIQWLDGAAGTLRGTLQRSLTGGLHFMSMAGNWIFANSMGRLPASTLVAADQTLDIDCTATSHAHIAFTANGADITALTFSNIYDGCRLTLSIFGTGTNAISWPGTGAGGVVTRTTEPQPIDGVMQTIELFGISGKLYEISRSSSPATRKVNAQTGTSYTVVLADADRDAFLTLSNAGAITLEIPTNATTAFPIGTVIEGMNLGAGDVTITGAGGVTVNGDPGLKVTGQPAAFGLLKTGTDTWQAYGKLSA